MNGVSHTRRSGFRRSVEDIIRGRVSGHGTLPLRALLRILTLPYAAVASLRNALYDLGLLPVHRITCRVIGIGNVTVGGTGKTPLTIMTARLCVEAGIPVAVVSRGYRGGASDVVVASDGERILAGPETAGDEPHLIASALPGVPVVVGRDRVAAARIAVERFHPAVVILDDGFQHRRLGRDLDIVTVDADYPPDRGAFLPRGPYRESCRSLARAGAVVVTRTEIRHDRIAITAAIRRFAPDAPIFFSSVVSRGLRMPGATDLQTDVNLAGEPVAVLSNVADPASFHRTVESLGARIVFGAVFPDHYRYHAEDIAAVEKDALAAGARFGIMTAKDERNLPTTWGVSTLAWRVLDIEAVIDDTADRERYRALIAP